LAPWRGKIRALTGAEIDWLTSNTVYWPEGFTQRRQAAKGREEFTEQATIGGLSFSIFPLVTLASLRLGALAWKNTYAHRR
jgi:hypothetical protein